MAGIRQGIICSAMCHISLILVVFVLNGNSKENDGVPCDQRTEGGQKDMERCLRKGDKFISRYLTSIRKGRRNFDKCSGLEDLTNCVDPLVTSCPALSSRVDSTWGPLLQQLRCACNGSQACEDTMECVEGQYGGVLARRCDAYYKFNLQQKTRNKCSFVEENVKCKETLIESGCGEKGIGRILSQLSVSKVITNAGCDIKDDTKLESFSFDKDCPSDLGARIERCQGKHLRSRQRLIFHDKNDLVVEGTTDDVTAACQNYHDYADCVSPIKEQCPVGSDMYLQHESRLRTYLMKIAYICDTAFKAYSSNLECFSEVLSHQNLTQCDHIFVGLKPLLQQVTAFQFYCRPNEEGSANLREHLDYLRQCYEGVFSSSCSGEGGTAMSGLIREVFNDPFYLRYKYKPDCTLHSIEDNSSTPKPTRPPDKGKLVASTGATCSFCINLKYCCLIVSILLHCTGLVIPKYCR